MSLDAGFRSCPRHDPSSCKELRLCWILCLAHHRSYLCHILHRRIPRQTRTAEKLLESRGHGELFQESNKMNTIFSGDLVRWIYFWNRSRNHCFSIPDLQLNSGKVGTRLKLCTEDVFTVLYILKSIYFRDIESFHFFKPRNHTIS